MTTDIEQAIKTYMDNPDDCPFCKSDLLGGNEEVDTRQRTVRTHCSRCGAEFTETFTLSGVAVDSTPLNMPFRFFMPPWVNPLEHGKGDLVGRRLWLDLKHLRDAMTPAGVEWWLDGACDKKQKSPVSRLWNGDDKPVMPPIPMDSAYIFVCCSDDGDPSEIWVSTEEATLEEIEHIMDSCMNNTGCTMVVGFKRDGSRHAELDMS